MLELSKVGCEDFASFSERRAGAGGHFGSSPLIKFLNIKLYFAAKKIHFYFSECINSKFEDYWQ